MSCNIPLGFSMASITVSGPIVGKKSEPAVALRQYDNFASAEFSVLDYEFSYFKNKDDNPGQFYKVSVTSKNAAWVAENLNHGSMVTVHGQPVWREYNGKKYLDIKNARVVPMEPRKTSTDDDSLF